MFGDLKLQVFDSSGNKLTEFAPRSKHKGLNRASWSMRMPPPIIPRSAGVPRLTRSRGCCRERMR